MARSAPPDLAAWIDPPFARRVVSWQRAHGRQTLPWQNTHDPYRIWLSEIMLQQTQVATVIPYYERFLARFPTVDRLAEAPESEVMALWAGLGYYTRARNLHRCARAVMADHAGRFPDTAEALAGLPGIGRSTAGAIAAFAYGRRSPILDGNVRRVFARHFGIEGDPGAAPVQRLMWERAEAELPRPAAGKPAFPEEVQREVMRAYTQGLMDLGATLCTRSAPRCGSCPVHDSCIARRDGRQHELPAPRQRRPLPTRNTQLLWMVQHDRVLLQQRPPQGIWGGLLSLPEFEGTNAESACRQLGLEPLRVQPLPPFLHTFTHFHLHATPWRVEVRPGQLEHDSSLCWVAQAELPEAPLPAPIRKLLTATLPLSFDARCACESP